MRTIRLSGLLAYAVMAMWLLQLVIAPARAAEAAAQSRLADHVEEFKAALIAWGVPDEARITLTAPNALIGAGPLDALLIDSVSYNAATGRFLIRAATNAGAQQFAVTGSAVTPVLAPVPVRAILRGEKIAEQDIDWVELADARAAAILTDSDAIIGKIARRPLAAGAPLRKADLTSPILIKRGASVTVILEAPGIRLSQMAVAMQNGAEGDLIALRNINSDREIKAVVAAENVAHAPLASRAAYASLQTE